jgi:hypothetical protein
MSSPYRWRTRKAWIGVKDHKDNLLGVIRRSGIVRATGHFCNVEVSVCGQKYYASGAEDRIWPFHSIRLKEGDKIPDLELEAVGWSSDGNTYAFRNKAGELVEIIRAGNAENNTRPFSKELKETRSSA